VLQPEVAPAADARRLPHFALRHPAADPHPREPGAGVRLLEPTSGRHGRTVMAAKGPPG
jgi:hypothetical protein